MPVLSEALWENGLVQPFPASRHNLSIIFSSRILCPPSAIWYLFGSSTFLDENWRTLFKIAVRRWDPIWNHLSSLSTQTVTPGKLLFAMQNQVFSGFEHCMCISWVECRGELFYSLSLLLLPFSPWKNKCDMTIPKYIIWTDLSLMNNWSTSTLFSQFWHSYLHTWTNCSLLPHFYTDTNTHKENRRIQLSLSSCNFTLTVSSQTLIFTPRLPTC